jgi:hypothetical protein
LAPVSNGNTQEPTGIERLARGNAPL